MFLVELLSHPHQYLIHDFLANQSYWAKDIPFNVLKKSIENALCFGYARSSFVLSVLISYSFSSIAYCLERYCYLTG